MWRRLPNANDRLGMFEGAVPYAVVKVCHAMLATTWVFHASAAIRGWRVRAVGMLVIALLATTCFDSMRSRGAGQETQQQNVGSAQSAEESLSKGQNAAAEMNAFSLVILHRSLTLSVWGKPLHANVRQTIAMFGKKMSGIGNYVRGGGGTGRMRYSLRFAADDSLNTLLQVCDGSRMLTIEDIGANKAQREIDLGKIRSQILPRLTLNSKSIHDDPINSIYLAIGGQAEVLRVACQRYYWHTAKESTIDGTPVWLLQGKLADAPPAIHGRAKVDAELFNKPLGGFAMPEIELAIATDQASSPYWLHRLVYRKPEEAPENGPKKTAIIAQTDWSSPKELTEDDMDIHLFQAPVVSSHSFSDETHRYMPPAELASKPVVTR